MAWFLTLLTLLGITLRAYGAPSEAAPAAKSSYCANVSDTLAWSQLLLTLAGGSLMISHKMWGDLILR